MSVHQGVNEGQWSVFAAKAVEERDAALARITELEVETVSLRAALEDSRNVAEEAGRKFIERMRPGEPFGAADMSRFLRCLGAAIAEGKASQRIAKR